MRSYHDEDGARHLHPVAEHQRDSAEGVAGRALQGGRSDALTSGAVAHLQRAAGNAGVSSLLAPEEEQTSPVLDVVGSGGSALDTATRTEMEASLGHDFSDVRIHTDGRASESAKAVQASAYTVGNDVVFGSGAYAPDTDAGKRTLAHELTHVVQQRSGPVDGTPTGDGVSISHPSDRFEQAAERSADTVMAGGRAGGEPSSSIQLDAESGEASVQRMQKDGNGVVGELVGIARTAPGRPIEHSARAPMEASFGRSFSEVELHQGSAVDAVAGAMGATAFAAGDHVYLHSQAPGPETDAGREILGEELAHVAQGVGAGGEVDRVLDAEGEVEHEAHAAAEAAATGKTVTIGPRADVGGQTGRFASLLVPVVGAVGYGIYDLLTDDEKAAVAEKGVAEAAQEVALEATLDPDEPSVAQIAALKVSALPPLEAVINKLTAHKHTVAPGEVAGAARDLDGVIRAHASPTGLGTVNAAADMTLMAHNTLVATVNPKGTLAFAAGQLKAMGAHLLQLVNGAQEPTKATEGQSPPEPETLTPAQARSLETGGVNQMLKVVEMLGKEEPDFDLIEGYLVGVSGTLSVLDVPSKMRTKFNNMVLSLAVVADGIRSSQLSTNDAVDKAIDQYKTARSMIHGLSSGTEPPADGS